ncbi:MAG: SDR family NAD(P)-dependent oxidoreductase, partial [Bacteroidota bacterium]
MKKIFEDRVAIVTGGSFGIGRATAIEFARNGAKVVVADWVEDTENLTLKGISEVRGEGIFIKTDISKSKDVQALIAKT